MHIRGTASFDVFCVKISFGPSAVASPKNQKHEHLGIIFHAYGEQKTPGRICTKFCTVGDIQNVITVANLGEDRLSRFCVAMGQILSFSIGFRSRPYKTLALPCQCYRASV